jgi:hypothetical protein
MRATVRGTDSWLRERSCLYLTVLCCPQRYSMAKVKKASLKAALSSNQARLKKRKQAEDAATHQQAKGATAKGRILRRSTIPFKAVDKILLVGEGNFSFAVALLQHPPAPLDHLPPANIVATAFDTEEECYAKYPDAEQNVRVLRESGVQVLFGIDATKLEKTSTLKGKVFDRIVWNFPHAGECAPLNCPCDALTEERARKGKESQTRTEIYCLIKFSSLAFFAQPRGSWFTDLRRKYSRPASANVPRVMMRMNVRMGTRIRTSEKMGVPEGLSS